MKSLNTPPAIREQLKLIVSFKRWYNQDSNIYTDKLEPFNANLYGHDMLFNCWLHMSKNIFNLPEYLAKVEKDFNPLDLYLSRSKGRQVIVNR